MARSPKDEALDLLKAGLATKAKDNKFGKRVRNVDQDPMDVGDTFTIPADYEVLEASINGGDPTPFILVPLVNEVTGITRNFRFFPNMLAKVVYPIVNGKRDGKVKTTGSAALEYQRFADQGEDGMDIPRTGSVLDSTEGKGRNGQGCPVCSLSFWSQGKD